VGGGVQLGPLGAEATNMLIVPPPGDYDDGEIGGMIGRGDRSTRRKPAPVPLCPPQTPHAARTRTLVAAVGGRRLTALSYGTVNLTCYFTHTLSLLLLLVIKTKKLMSSLTSGLYPSSNLWKSHPGLRPPTG
jgi:hypothetical protein